MIPVWVPFLLMTGAYLAQFTIDATWGKPVVQVDDETGDEVQVTERLWSTGAISWIRRLAAVLFLAASVTAFFIE